MHTDYMQRILDIHNEQDYRDALLRFIHLCEMQKNDEDLKEILLLTRLMEKYERENCGIN
jgi:antitoxin component HigA of HigAB toxin-antitoxin module